MAPTRFSWVRWCHVTTLMHCFHSLSKKIIARFLFEEAEHSICPTDLPRVVGVWIARHAARSHEDGLRQLGCNDGMVLQYIFLNAAHVIEQECFPSICATLMLRDVLRQAQLASRHMISRSALNVFAIVSSDHQHL